MAFLNKVINIFKPSEDEIEEQNRELVLFSLENVEDSSPAGAQKLKITEGELDVAHEFAWKLSPSNEEIPTIILEEFKLKNNSIIQQAVYRVLAAAEAGSDTVNTVNKVFEDLLESERGQNSEEFNNPYYGVYAVEPTGHLYVFPYFSGGNHNHDSNWGKIGQGAIEGVVSQLAGVVKEGTTALNVLQSALDQFSNIEGTDTRPVTYIEQAQQYRASEPPSYNFDFYLFNTNSVEDVRKNWELCFILLYQNMPNRRNKTIFDPPHLYSVEIPGVRYSPISFISNITIRFEGSTRQMEIFEGKGEFVVPEAYRVSIALKDAFPESQNFLESLLDKSLDIRTVNGGS